MQYPTNTKVTIGTPDGICSLEIHNTNINLEDLMESLIIPALLGSGYSEESVEKYRSIGDQEDEEKSAGRRLAETAKILERVLVQSALLESKVPTDPLQTG